MVHELIHSLELEKHHDYGEVKEFVYHHFDIQRSNALNLFECYVEIMAEIVNIILLDKKKFNKLIILATIVGQNFIKLVDGMKKKKQENTNRGVMYFLILFLGLW